MKKNMTPREKQHALWGLVFIAPTILGLLLLNYYPIFQIVYQSFCKTGDFGIGNTFIGIENYTRLIQDKEVFIGLWNAVKYSLLSIPLTLLIPLVLAVLLNRKMKLRSVYRTIYFHPMAAVYIV